MGPFLSDFFAKLASRLCWHLILFELYCGVILHIRVSFFFARSHGGSVKFICYVMLVMSTLMTTHDISMTYDRNRT